MNPCFSRLMAFASEPGSVGTASSPDLPERAHAVALAEARAALAAGVLGEPEGIAACLRNLEALAHHGRLRGRALLLERPMPGWVGSHVRALHERVGCRQRATGPLPRDESGELSRALARLPWSGEWLVRVLEGLPDAAATRARDLAAAWQARRNAFVEAHVGLVDFVARRRGWIAGIAREDLIQEGCLALCRAVERYEPGRGTRFSSYAVPVLQRAMAHAIREMGNPPAAPPQLSRASVSACPLRMRGPAVAERNKSRPPALVSLDAVMDGSDDSGTLAERLTDPNALLPDVSAMRGIERERLRAAFAALSRDVQQVLALHWGLEDRIPRSVHQIGRLLDRPVEEIRAIVATSRRLLYQRLEGAHRAPSGCADIAGAGHRVTFQYLPWRTPGPADQANGGASRAS